MFVFGGRAAINSAGPLCSDRLHVLDLVGRTWQDLTQQTRGSRPSARHGHNAVVVGSNMWMVGGVVISPGSSTGTWTSRELYRLDLQTLEWSLSKELPHYSTGLAWAGIAPVGNSFFVFGGAACDPGCKCSRKLWTYRIKPGAQDGNWSLASANGKQDVFHTTLVSGDHGALYSFGGESCDPSAHAYHNDVWRYLESAVDTAVLHSHTSHNEL